MRAFIYNSKVEAIAQEAKNSATIAALENACQRLDIADVISLGKIDLQLAKYALAAVYKSYKKYPYLRGTVNYFGTLGGYDQHKERLLAPLLTMTHIDPTLRRYADEIFIQTITRFESDGLALAFCLNAGNNFAGGIIVNGKTFNCQSIINNLKHGENIGLHPQGCRSIRSIIDHEIGHLLDIKLGIRNSKEFLTFIKTYDIESVKRGLSSYSVMGGNIDNGEVIADGYAEYRNNPQPREIATTIGRIIDLKYKKLCNNLLNRRVYRCD